MSRQLRVRVGCLQHLARVVALSHVRCKPCRIWLGALGELVAGGSVRFYSELCWLERHADAVSTFPGGKRVHDRDGVGLSEFIGGSGRWLLL